ncbi:MAG TPA: fatty-acid--CoA ligase FadD1 [Nocardioides sp.]|uniref:fatty-acid--CoA ligase FadD1 n=1 Tax=Nocardioides sp. TaxID=35761 RepID=UPI002E3651EC|nr:fatty-acid--CoA ligase FadD1 [Nocardioides sp.]HEX5086322.1 fatty-acid--CoA ligase FadD1 [Nocardioides sp.]
MAETVQQLLRERAADAAADRVAVRYGDRSWTWREHLAEAAAEASAVIALADPRRPLHVGVLLGNTPDMLRSMAAAALGGYVLVGLNTTRQGPALLADVRRADCQLVLVNAEHTGLLEGLELGDVGVVDVASLEPAAELVPHADVGPMDTLMMIFTSGTSGEPKAVQVPHIFPIFSGANLVDRFSITADDVCYVSMPLFHSNAVVAGWAVAATSGATIVPARFSASGLIDDVRRYGATYLNYVGKPLAYVLATPERPDDADNPLRVAFGNEASDRDIEEFGRRFGCQVVDGFGSTESGVTVTRPPGTPPGSIGQGLDGVAVYDAATVTECEVAEFSPEGVLLNADRAVGQLVNTQGAGMFQGYYNDDSANAERMAHGMYWSGDLAYKDADGWIYLAGRTADWMRVDGENLAAAPIERILQRLPAVALVAVYAVPDDNVGDQVMAAMVLHDEATLSPEELAAFLSDQPDLPAKGRPRYVRVAPELPSTATNKVLKRELVAQGATAGDGVLWVREDRGTAYSVAS